MAQQSATAAIERSKLGDSVYRLLWERILARELHPGQKLSDLRLSEELAVSRTPVREALHRLVQDGIVRAEPHRGFYVASFSARDVAEIYDLRANLEEMALQAAAPKLSAKGLKSALADLDRVSRQLEAARTEQERMAASAAFLRIDQGFHRWLVEQAGNRRLTAMVEGLWAQIAVFQKAGAQVLDWTEQSIAQHHAMIEALLAGDLPAATRHLREHIDEVKERVISDLATGGAVFPSSSGKRRRLAP